MTGGERRGAGHARYAAGRVARHWRWARTEGVSRLVEEDRLDPLERVRTGLAKARWRRSHHRLPGSARPVYVVGLQRSGTNMLLRALDNAPCVEVHNENDQRVFRRFELRSDDAVVDTVRRSRHLAVAFKPLCESHRVAHLLDDLPLPVPGRAVWAWRDVDDRTRSAVSKFGDANLRALRAVAAGDRSAWQAGGLDEGQLDVIASFDYTSMTPETAAALFWWARNSVYFGLGLDTRPDVLLVAYDDVVERPVVTLAQVFAFLGLPWDPAYARHVETRHRAHREVPLDPRVRALCDDLAGRLRHVTYRGAREGAAR